jgi:predicted metal-dependent hydrolase
VAGPPAGLRRTPTEALAEGARLLDAGLPFHAHEVLEDAWRAAPDDERELWQGLAQLAVGCTHAARGNPVGAHALLRRGAARVAEYRTLRPYGLDLAGLLRWTEAALGSDLSFAATADGAAAASALSAGLAACLAPTSLGA